MRKINVKANPIWTQDAALPNRHVVFKKEFTIDMVPEKAIAYIAVDTKYWLYINGECAVYEGGLFRESMPGCGYADAVDISPFLSKGENIIAVHVWYYGNQGRNSVDSGCGAFLFECGEIGVYSDSTFKCLVHPAYYNTDKPRPSGLYGGYNIGFDAKKDVENIYGGDTDEGLWGKSIEISGGLGDLYARPIPQLRWEKCESTDYETSNNEYVLHLPYAMWFSPTIEVDAEENTVIDIRSDRYAVNGGPGDENNAYNSQRVEYICKHGINRFESLLSLFGEKIIIRCSKPVSVLKLGYYESGYDCDLAGKYICNDKILNTLIEKATRTLYVCMRDNFMDCPDRERGQWIGDVSVQAPQVFFALSPSAQKLLKKTIHDFIFLRKGDVLVGNVPGVNYSELPAQSLNAISEVGLIANYYHYTRDAEVLKWAFEPAVAYLNLWDIEEGLVKNRKGDWNWYDHLHNIDIPVLENAWYYSALKFVRFIADELDIHKHDEWIDERMQSIGGAFDRSFWKGSYYASDNWVDDRANAMAVLSGLCPEQNYAKVRDVLLKVFCASVYMENYVLSALCEMGYPKDALNRMISRYYNLAMNDNSTLWEDFYILGTKNHAWSGAPVNIAFKYFLGLDTEDGFDTFTVKPAEGLFERQEASIMTRNGLYNITCDGGNVKIEKNEISL